MRQKKGKYNKEHRKDKINMREDTKNSVNLTAISGHVQ